MKQNYNVKRGRITSSGKLIAFSFLASLLLNLTSLQAQNTTYYSGNSSDLSHYKVVNNSNGTGSFSAEGTGIKITSTASGDLYVLGQHMFDTARNFITALDLFPTDAVSGVISFRIVNQPAQGLLVVRLGLYSVEDNCDIISMPVTYSGLDAEKSTQYTAAHQADNTNYIVDLSSNEMRTQINTAFTIAVATHGPYTERPEGFVLKFGWASYTGAQSSITIDNIVYSAPTNLGVDPISCFNMPTILPVSLKSFEAKPTSGRVQLSWATASESGNPSFTIERSTDNKNFNAIGTVAGTGTSTSAKSYTFDDLHPVLSTAWYRLRITDKDGSVKYSAVKAVFSNTGLGQTVLIQNGHSLQSIKLDGWNLQQSAILSLTDAAGRTISTSKVTLDNRVIQLSNTVPAGLYMIRLQQGDKKAVARLVF